VLSSGMSFVGMRPMLQLIVLGVVDA
jgi:hypothetical protein